MKRQDMLQEEVDTLRERDREYHKIRRKRPSYLEYLKMSAERDKEKRKPAQKNAVLKNKYGITLEDYKCMFEAQDGVCAICEESEEGRLLAVDHCHETNKVRGLLCGSCNRALGLFKDDPILLSRAKEYVS